MMISRDLDDADGFFLAASNFPPTTLCRCSCLDPLVAVAVAAVWAPVLLDMLRPGGGDLDALPVVPLLAVVAADPELVLAIVGPTGSAQGVVVLFFLVITAVVAAILVFILGG
jgi:hypothetical protein